MGSCLGRALRRCGVRDSRRGGVGGPGRDFWSSCPKAAAFIEETAREAFCLCPQNRLIWLQFPFFFSIRKNLFHAPDVAHGDYCHFRAKINQTNAFIICLFTSEILIGVNFVIFIYSEKHFLINACIPKTAIICNFPCGKFPISTQSVIQVGNSIILLSMMCSSQWPGFKKYRLPDKAVINCSNISANVVLIKIFILTPSIDNF